MVMLTKTILIQTIASFSCHSITTEIEGLLEQSGLKEGVITIFSRHTTTALIVNEMEERLIMDLEKWLSDLIPAGKGYKHDDLHLRENIPENEPINAHSHLRALLLGSDVSLPFQNHKLLIGTYQDIIFVELDGPRRRKVIVSILGM